MHWSPRWLNLLLALLALSGLIGLDLFKTHENIASESRERLLRQAEAVNKNLSQRLQTTNNALALIRTDLALLLGPHSDPALLNRRLQAMATGMSGVRSIVVANAQGVIIGSNRQELIGIDFNGSERYKTIRKSLDPAMLHVSAPFTTPLGVYAISLGKVILDEQGGFNGYVLAILDPEYFQVLLDSVLYAPDMRATLIHGDGKIVVRVPDPEHSTGTDLRALPNSFFNQYVKRGQTVSVFTGVSASTGDQRLSVIQAIRPQASPADKPLLVSVSREYSAMYAPWRKQLVQQVSLLAIIALIAISWLLYSQRRKTALARMTARHGEEQKVADQKFKDNASSLQLAIDGARLGTWHWNITTNEMKCSQASLALFGLPPDIQMTDEKFFNVLHPQDRQRITESVDRSIHTNTDYNEEYRVIWPDGSIRWINAMGRPFCAADGTVERMEGIAQDINERRVMEEQIRQSSAELVRVNEELHQLARSDALTGLANRLAANERLHTEFVNMKRSTHNYAVMMVDIDFFKRVNDTHGHAVGDQVLHRVAQILKKTSRESDFVARFGGEEFLVLLPATEMPAARQVAEKLRHAVETSPDPVAGGITVSIGLALAHPQQAQEGQAVREADGALYQAKHEGRNQVQVAPESLTANQVVDAMAAR